MSIPGSFTYGLIPPPVAGTTLPFHRLKFLSMTLNRLHWATALSKGTPSQKHAPFTNKTVHPGGILTKPVRTRYVNL